MYSKYFRICFKLFSLFYFFFFYFFWLSSPIVFLFALLFASVVVFRSVWDVGSVEFAPTIVVEGRVEFAPTVVVEDRVVLSTPEVDGMFCAREAAANGAVNVSAMQQNNAKWSILDDSGLVHMLKLNEPWKQEKRFCQYHSET